MEIMAKAVVFRVLLERTQPVSGSVCSTTTSLYFGAFFTCPKPIHWTFGFDSIVCMMFFFSRFYYPPLVYFAFLQWGEKRGKHTVAGR